MAVEKIKRKKPDFFDVYYDPSTVVWGKGNDIVGLKLIARIDNTDYEPTMEELIKQQEDYENAKKIYSKINVGQRFKPSGKNANPGVEAKITFIHPEKQTVTWMQDNVDAFKSYIPNAKPARGRFTINGMIALIKSGEITLLNPTTH